MAWSKLFLLAFLISVPRVTAQESKPQESPQALEKRFREEAPKAWIAYWRQAMNLQGTILIHQKGNTFEHREQKEIRQNANAILLSSLVLDSSVDGTERFRQAAVKGMRMATVYTTHRQFMVCKMSETSGWELTDFQKSAAGGYLQEGKLRCESLLVPALYPHIQQTLLDLIYDPTFKVESIERKQEAGLIEVKFSNRHALNTIDRFPACEGILVFLEKPCWLPLSNELKYLNWSPGSISRRRFEYRDLSSPFPVIQRVTDYQTGEGFADDKNPARRYEITDIHEYDLSIPKVLPPEEEFALSKFGLKEPPDRSNIPIVIPEELDPRFKMPVYGWVLLGIAGMALIALLLARLTFKARRGKTLSWDQ